MSDCFASILLCWCEKGFYFRSPKKKKKCADLWQSKNHFFFLFYPTKSSHLGIEILFPIFILFFMWCWRKLVVFGWIKARTDIWRHKLKFLFELWMNWFREINMDSKLEFHFCWKIWAIWNKNWMKKKNFYFAWRKKFNNDFCVCKKKQK